LHGQVPGETIYYLIPYSAAFQTELIKKIHSLFSAGFGFQYEGGREFEKYYNDTRSDTILNYQEKMTKTDLKNFLNYEKFIKYKNKKYTRRN
jgi:hypothetical protein